MPEGKLNSGRPATGEADHRNAVDAKCIKQCCDGIGLFPRTPSDIEWRSQIPRTGYRDHPKTMLYCGLTKLFSLIVSPWLAVHKQDYRAGGSKNSVLDPALRRLHNRATTFEPPSAIIDPSLIAECRKSAECEYR